MNLLALASAAMNLLIPQAFASDLNTWANAVGFNGGNGLVAAFDGCTTLQIDASLCNGYTPIAAFIIIQARNIIYAIGVFVLVRSGLRLIVSQEDDKLNKAKRTIAATCVGIILAHLAQQFAKAFFAPGGVWNPGTAEDGAEIIALEVTGIINWVLMLIVVVAILMIVASAIKGISSFGKEEGEKEVRQTIAGVITGLGLILLSGAIKVTLGLLPGTGIDDPTDNDTDPLAIVRIGVDVVINILMFLALAAIAVIIYAALVMILNLGNEDQFKKGKDIIVRVLIGLVVILFSVVVVTLIKVVFLDSQII